MDASMSTPCCFPTRSGTLTISFVNGKAGANGVMITPSSSCGATFSPTSWSWAAGTSATKTATYFAPSSPCYDSLTFSSSDAANVDPPATIWVDNAYGRKRKREEKQREQRRIEVTVQIGFDVFPLAFTRLLEHWSARFDLSKSSFFDVD
jgi:hypothetical protein